MLTAPNFRSDFECKFKVNSKFKLKCEFHQVQFSDVVFASFRCWWWWLPLPPLLVVMTAAVFPLSVVVVAVLASFRGGEVCFCSRWWW